MQPARYQNLRDYLFVLRVNRVLIVALTLLAGGLAYVVSARQSPVYRATASMAFQDETRDLGLLGSPVAANSAPDQLPTSRAQTITSPAVARQVRRVLRTRRPAAELASHISTSVEAGTGLVLVRATDRAPRFAAALAAAFAVQDQKITNAASRARFRRAAAAVRSRIRRLRSAAADAQLRGVLTDQLARLEFLSTTASPARVVKTQARGQKVSPRPKRNTLIGLILGLTLGVGAAFLRDALDRRLRGSQSVADEVDLPVIGHVRAEAFGRAAGAGGGNDPKFAIDIESFQIIRQNLDFLSEEALTTVLVTSGAPQEGKSTVAASLAWAAAAANRRTLLVECDMRRPMAATRLGLRRTPGLSEFLAGDAERSAIVQTVAQLGRDGDRAQKSGRGLALECIAAGGAASRPADLLGSDRFRALLADLAAEYDMVVLDSSPLIPVADTLELLPLVDGVVLCVRSGQTTREQACAAKAAIDHYPGRPVGLVVTGLRARDEPDYAALYGYADYTAPAG
jgi:succinoglycan biosynthesis transport protein ExoP